MERCALTRITRSPLAESDLIDIWTYIAARNDTAADALLDRINAKLDMLASTSGLGTPRPDLAPTLRSFVVGRYVLYYLPIDDGIELVRVIHGARDMRGQRFG